MPRNTLLDLVLKNWTSENWTTENQEIFWKIPANGCILLKVAGKKPDASLKMNSLTGILWIFCLDFQKKAIQKVRLIGGGQGI